MGDDIDVITSQIRKLAEGLLMSKMDKRLYKGRAALNVLANSVENAKEVFDAAEGHVLVGVLSKNYSNVEAAVEAMKEYGCSD